MDQAFNPAFVRPFSRQVPRAQPPSPAPAPRGVGQAPRGLGQATAVWDTTTRGPIPPGINPYDPPPGGPTWSNYAWIYMSTNGLPPPSAPPPGVMSAGGAVIGTWVEEASNRWVWFAPDNTLTQINGIWVMDNSNAPGTASPMTAFPAPTMSPDGTQGAWSEPHAGYWIWVPGIAAAASTAVTSMSTGTVLLLAILGLGAVGGIGYLLLD